MSGRIVFVEDSLARVTQIRRLLELYRSGDAVRDGRRLGKVVIAEEEYWDPSTALARLVGDAAAGVEPERWHADDQLFMDCWNRDAMDAEVSHARSTFYALDLLAALRDVREAGGTIPRVVVHSRGMRDDLLRAALAEFTLTRRMVRVVGGTPVQRWRLDVAGDTSGSVIWAMFDRTDLERNFDRILTGDRTLAMRAPEAGSAVWAQILPTSCLASFHGAIRDECPDVWDSHVICRVDPSTHGCSCRSSLDAAVIARVTRAAHRYLELNDSWGARGYKGYLAIARALANPDS